MATATIAPAPAAVRAIASTVRSLIRQRDEADQQAKKLRSQRIRLEAACNALADLPEEDLSATDFYRGAPRRAERLEHIRADITQAIAEESAAEEQRDTADEALAAARADLHRLVVQELRSRAKRSDELLQQVEQLTAEMDALEAIGSELGVALPNPHRHCDPLCWGGWSFTRPNTTLYPDGRRESHGYGSLYRAERERKRAIGQLEVR
jgi:DNA repair exonuclease SbcCD ATPase subunit